MNQGQKEKRTMDKEQINQGEAGPGHTDPEQVVTSKDFKLDTPVKWCAGCGAHSVLSTIRNVLPETGVKRENIVFVSGIGCSSRFPYTSTRTGFTVCTA